MESSKPKTGRNTTAITNPKTKSQNTTANTKSAGKSASSSHLKSAPSKTAKSGFGRNSASASQSKSPAKASTSAGSKSKSSSSEGKSQSQSWSKPSSKAGAKMEVSNEFCQLKDFDIASDILGGQKALLKLYGTALCETDCPNLRNIINTQLSEVAVDQFDVFTYMNQRGMYPTEQAPAGKVKQAITKYNQKAILKKNQK